MTVPQTLSYGPATISVETITPEMAQDILDTKNIHNRPLKKTAVAQMADDMARGRFNLQGDPIKFDVNGVLLDGQNRLAAVARAGVPVLFIVVRGLATETQITMDSGSKRTAADNLRIDGMGANATVVAAATRGIFLFEKADRQPSNLSSGIQNHDSYDFLQRNPRILDGIDTIKALAKVNGLKAKAHAAVIWWAISEVGGEKADEFFEGLITGANLAPDSPILALRVVLERNASAKGGNHSGSIAPVAIAFKAWNAWLAGKPVNRLSFRASGPRREAFPTPNTPMTVVAEAA